MSGRSKVSIIGAGMVGHTTAHWLAAEEVADLVLVDIIEKMPMGKALDLTQAAPIRGVDVRITGSNGYEETAGSDVVVIIAGVARKPGMTREQLLDTNGGIVRGVVELMGSSAFFAPGAAIAQMVEAIVRDKKRLIPCSVYLDGEYGQRDVCVGVPVVLGRDGVERIIELPLDPRERAAFSASVGAVREQLGSLKL